MTGSILLMLNLSIATTFQPLSIANRVAGDGAPNCIEYSIDGSERPCIPTFYFTKNNSIDAKSVGSDIFFNIGTVNNLNSDEFAILAGHEIAHYYLGHAISSRKTELEADRLGAELACNAGFDPIQGISVFRFAHGSFSHPSAAERIAAVRSVSCPGNPAGPGPRTR